MAFGGLAEPQCIFYKFDFQVLAADTLPQADCAHLSSLQMCILFKNIHLNIFIQVRQTLVEKRKCNLFVAVVSTMFFKERTTLSCFYKEVFCSSSLGKEGYVKKKKNLYSKLSSKKSITVIDPYYYLLFHLYSFFSLIQSVPLNLLKS